MSVICGEFFRTPRWWVGRGLRSLHAAQKDVRLVTGGGCKPLETESTRSVFANISPRALVIHGSGKDRQICDEYEVFALILQRNVGKSSVRLFDQQ